MPHALVIIAKEGFQDHEYEGTREGLEAGGFAVMVASTEAGPCAGKFGASVEADIAMRDADLSDVDRIAFVGGPGAASLQDDDDAKALARGAYESGKVVGAICIAPTILAKAKVLTGKNATVWNGDGNQAALLEAHGASFTGDAVTVDGTIVTANGPDAAEEFGKTLARLE